MPNEPTAKRKLVDLGIDEVSGVDHPAHLSEGWMVLKNAGFDDDTAAFVAEVLAEAERLRKQAADDPDSDEETTEMPTVEELDSELTKAQERIAELEAAIAAEGPGDEGDDDVLKALPEPVRKMIEDANARAEEALAKAAAADEREALAKTRSTVTDLGHLPGVTPDEFTPVLRAIEVAAPEAATKLVEVLKAANGALESSALFSELGKGFGGVAGDPYTKLEALVADRMSKSTDTDSNAAWDDVLATPEGAALYAEYRKAQEAAARGGVI